MSTTRHLINRQRRLAATAPPRERVTRTAEAATDVDPDSDTDTATDTATATDIHSDTDPETEAEGGGRSDRPARGRAATAVRTRPARPPRTSDKAADVTADVTAGTPTGTAADAEPEAGSGPRKWRPRPVTVLTVGLALLTVLLGGLAAWSAGKASDLRDSVASGNTALTDTARTSEVKGTVAQAVNAVFSYNYADTARTDDAAKRVLTGKAVQQYATMLTQVRAQAPAQKLVLTTTVTDTGVELLDGDRARVLVFADQSNTSTAKSANAATTYAAAMFAVDAVHQDGTWKIASIDTFG
ncbi:hypothetical protein ACIOC1_09440 [Streptomyces sp. NPDC088197]|uniref:hypothetical protein n=1 Tax=Streptomyces sp. NPDC088197 TaxID=3365840 RepID=UPI003808112D